MKWGGGVLIFLRFFFLVKLWGMWDLSSKAPCSGRMESSPLDHQASPGACVCEELARPRERVHPGTAQHKRAELSGSGSGLGQWESRGKAASGGEAGGGRETGAKGGKGRLSLPNTPSKLTICLGNGCSTLEYRLTTWPQRKSFQ